MEHPALGFPLALLDTIFKDDVSLVREVVQQLRIGTNLYWFMPNPLSIRTNRS